MMRPSFRSAGLVPTRLTLGVVLLASTAALGACLNAPSAGTPLLSSIRVLAEYESFHIAAHLTIFFVFAMTVTGNVLARFAMVVAGTMLIETAQILGAGARPTTALVMAGLFDLAVNMAGATAGTLAARVAGRRRAGCTTPPGPQRSPRPRPIGS